MRLAIYKHDRKRLDTSGHTPEFFSQRSKGAGNEKPAVAKAKGTDKKR
jgi:hypothetical protein